MMPRHKNRNAEVLRTFALGFPEAREDFPWGERVVKVKDKVFVFLGRDDEDLGVTVKLPSSGLLALGLPFASPTGYGLGKSGWVTARFTAKDKPPLDVLRKWIDESYRAVAPKELVAKLDAPPKRPAPRPGPRKKRARRVRASGRW
jgi:predicted DNA-binding protein (MmcQ/YjbR family)